MVQIIVKPSLPRRAFSTNVSISQEVALSGRAQHGSNNVAVFDRRHSKANTPEARVENAKANFAVFGNFRERDHTPAREVVTARLLGDPAPDRPRPSEPIIPENRIATASGPVLLTFRELEASKKLRDGDTS